MNVKTLTQVGAIALALIAAPSMLNAQAGDPSVPPAAPDSTMQPAPPAPLLLPPVAVPAEPMARAVLPERMVGMAVAPNAQSAYPPCSATLQDQCTNTRPEADVKAVRPVNMPPRRRHHKR
jgi:hypothetical protein